MDPKEIGLRLKALREAKGQSKRHVARATGISYTSICAYEYGWRNPSDRSKIALAKHFGVSVGSIFFTK